MFLWKAAFSGDVADVSIRQLNADFSGHLVTAGRDASVELLGLRTDSASETLVSDCGAFSGSLTPFAKLENVLSVQVFGRNSSDGLHSFD